MGRGLSYVQKFVLHLPELLFALDMDDSGNDLQNNQIETSTNREIPAGYFPARVLAAKYGYSKDYLTRLLRRGHIKGFQRDNALREWFVDESSLKVHRQKVLETKVPTVLYTAPSNSKGSLNAEPAKGLNAIPKKLLLIAGGILFLINFIPATDFDFNKTPFSKQYSQIKQTVSDLAVAGQADILDPVRDFVRKYLLPEYGVETYLVIDPYERLESRIKELELRIKDQEPTTISQQPTVPLQPPQVIIREIVSPDGVTLASIADLEQRISNLSDNLTSFQRITPTTLQLPPTNTVGIGEQTFNTDNINSDTLTVSGSSTLSSLGITNDLTVDTNVFKVDTSNNRVGINTATPEVALEVVGTASISGALTVGGQLNALGNIGIGTTSAPNELTVIGSGSFTGQLKATRNPTLAHTGTWPSFTNTSDATVLINPSSPVADGNVIAYVSGSDPKFIVDTEGDIYGNNLILTGSTTTGTTTIAGDLNVEGNTTFGDAVGDTVAFTARVNSSIVPATDATFDIGASTSGNLFRWRDGYFTNSIQIGSSTLTINTASISASGELEIESRTSNPVRFSTNGSERVRVAADGNVGIGTTSPLTKLDVIGNASVSQDFEVAGRMGIGQTHPSWDFAIFRTEEALMSIQSTTTAASGRSLLSLYTENALNGVDLQVNNALRTTEAGALSFNIIQYNDAPIALYTNSTEKVRITGAGNVGIGTTSPDQLLELSSADTKFIIRSTGATSSASIDFQPAGGASSSNQNKFTIRAGGLAGSAGERLDILNGTGTELFTIASDGNVGIGTTAPGLGGAYTADKALTLDGGTSSALEDTFALEIGGSTNTDGRYAGMIAFYNADNSGAVAATRKQISLIRSEVETSDSNADDDSGGHLSFLTKAEAGTLTEKMRIQSGGNVGIGTTGPLTLLHLNSATPVIRLTESGIRGAQIHGYAEGGVSGGALGIYTTNSAGTQTEHFRINMDGNVGIGTTVPVAKFHVENTAVGEASILSLRKAGVNGDLQTILFQMPTGNGVPTSVAAIRALSSGVAATTVAGNLVFITGDQAATGERMRIDNSGNVGIGTTTPGSPLDVITADTVGRKMRVSSANRGLDFFVIGTAGVPMIQSIGNLQALEFQAGNENTSNYLFTSTGNVGIGTTGPTTKLQIVGGNCSDDAGGGGCTADFAEIYPSSENVEKGDVVMVDPLASVSYSVKKSDGQGVAIGVVSTAPAAIADSGNLRLMANEYALDPRNPAIALAGRTPVKATDENGEIKVGDRLTASKTKPGYAMRQTEAGQSIGIALEELNTIAPGSYSKILAFVNNGYWAPADSLSSGSDLLTQDSGAIFDLDILFNSIVKKFGEVMGIVFEKGVLKVADIIAGKIKSDSVETKKLCLEDFCVTKDQLKSLFENGGAGIAPQSVPTPTPEPEPTPEPTPEATPEATPESTPSESPSPEPLPSPSPSPTPEPTSTPSESPTPSPTPEPTQEPSPESEPSPEEGGTSPQQESNIGTGTPEPTPSVEE